MIKVCLSETKTVQAHLPQCDTQAAHPVRYGTPKIPGIHRLNYGRNICFPIFDLLPVY